MQSDEAAFLEAIRAHSGIMRKVANAYCSDISERDDLLQEITIQIWRSWGKYDPSYKMTTWIYRIALNVAISFFRKSHRHRAINNATGNPESVATRGDETLSENVRQLYEFVAELSEMNRALILLYLDNFSHEEIAQTLGISRTNVATKISRIKKQLRQRFEQSEEQNEH